MIVAIYIVGLIYFVIRWRIQAVQLRSENERKLNAAQLQARESELALLRNQMNPHFIFNALNSIQNFIFKQEAEKANYFLSRFSALIRKSLEFSKKSWISLKDELKYLRQYLEMESMRFPDKFNYKIEIQHELDISNLQIPTLLLQPVIENSVKHGFKNLKYSGNLLIYVRQSDNESLQIIIEDNGIGVQKRLSNHDSPNTDHSRQPHGLQIIRDRLKLLQEELPGRSFSFMLSEAQNFETGTRVVFIRPVMIKDHAEIGSHR
jgi:LytS/YehU family sensor histidine kinase